MNDQSFATSQLTPSQLPPGLGKGTYILILQLKRKRRLKIGRSKNPLPSCFAPATTPMSGALSGQLDWRAGSDAIFGRTKRASGTSIICVKFAEPVEVWIYSGKKRMEREWADALNRMEGSQPVEGFGNTDDRG